MIKVDFWELVRDWVEARYKYVKVQKFSDDQVGGYPTEHLGRITAQLPGYADEIGFVGPKGVLIWPPGDKELAMKRDYEIFRPTDPQMFEKLDKILVMYESQGPK